MRGILKKGIICTLGLLAIFIVILTFRNTTNYADNVVVITPRINDQWYSIPRVRVDWMSSFFPEHSIVGVMRNRQRLYSDHNNAVAWVYHVSPGYFNMYQAYFTESEFSFEENKIVINEALAWLLFGNTDNVNGLRIMHMDTEYHVYTVVAKGNEPTAWRLETDGMISALYIRTYDYDPLATAIARQMLSNHLFVNPDDYYILNVNRAVQRVGVQAKILLAVMLLVVAGILFSYSHGMFKGKKYLASLLFGLCFLGSVVVFIFVVNSVLVWLPNPEAIDVSMFTYLFR